MRRENKKRKSRRDEKIRNNKNKRKKKWEKNGSQRGIERRRYLLRNHIVIKGEKYKNTS